MKSTHIGFKAVQSKIAQRYGMERAGAILASSTRKAGASARKRNPRLNRVKGTSDSAVSKQFWSRKKSYV